MTNSYRRKGPGLFVRLLTTQLIILIPLVFLSTLAIQWMSFPESVERHVWPPLEWEFWVILAGLLAVTAGWAAFVSWQLVFPIGRLVHLIRRLSIHERVQESPLGEEPKAEIPDDWEKLEQLISRLGDELQIQSETLHRERRELEIVLSSISDAVFAVTPNREMMFFNTSFASLFRGKQLRQKPVRLAELIRDPECLSAIESALKEGAPSTVLFQMRVRDESAPRYFSVSIAPLRRRDDQATYGVIGVLHDVSVMKRTEQVQAEFIQNVSHELRTPMTSIKGYIDTLKEDLEENRFDSMRVCVDKVSRNVGRLKDLVENLLDLSFLEASGDLHKELLSTREATEFMLSQLEHLAIKKGIKILPVYLTDAVLANDSRLNQVLRNLVENAIKYIPAGKQIEIIWRPLQAGGAELEITDNGPGIAPEFQERLFDRFFRVDVEAPSEEGGSGLGLAIARHIMTRHGGSIEARSISGEGARFICRFPG